MKFLFASFLLVAACTGAPGQVDEPDAGPTEPDAGPTEPDARPTEPDAGPIEPDPWSDAVAMLGNNGARFQPPEVSYAPRERLAYRVVAPGNEPFEVDGTAYAMARLGVVRVFFKIKNTGADIRCFVALEDIDFRDADGGPVPEDGTRHSFAIGSVRRLLSLTTATCLASQESTWMVYESGLTQTEMFAVTEVNVRVTSRVPASDTAEPVARVVPTRMQLTPTDARFELVNQGTGLARINSIDWLAFDRDGRPVGWDLLPPPPPALAPGASTVVELLPAGLLDNAVLSPVAGTVASSIIRVDYEDTSQ